MAWLCSNEKCSDKSKREKGSICPTCGSLVQEYKYTRLFSHLSLKSKIEKRREDKEGAIAERTTSNKNEALLLSEMSDQEIEDAIRKDLRTKSFRHTWSDLADVADLVESGRNVT